MKQIQKNVIDAKSSTHVRNSSIELLRILCMFMVVMSHYAFYGLRNGQKISLGGIDQDIAQGWLSVFGESAVAVFLIISGYFLVKSQAKVHKLVNLWLQVFTYSILVYIVLVALHQVPFSLGAFLQALLPVTYTQYWFITAYILIYIFSPFINKMLLKLTEKQFLAFLALLGYVVSSGW